MMTDPMSLAAGIPNIPPGVASALGKMQAVPGAPPLPGSSMVHCNMNIKYIVD